MCYQWEHDQISRFLDDVDEASTLAPSRQGLKSLPLRQLLECRKVIASGMELLEADIKRHGFDVPSLSHHHLQPEVGQNLDNSPESRDQAYDSSKMSKFANFSEAWIPFTEAWVERRKRDQERVEAALTVLQGPFAGLGSWTDDDLRDGTDDYRELETHHVSESPVMPLTSSVPISKKHVYRQKILDRIKKHQHRGTVKLATLSHSSSWRTLLQTSCLSAWLNFFLSNLDDWVENATAEEWDWLTKIANFLDRLSKRFRRYRYQLLIYALLFLLFSEFASNTRPFCTTMPWNIKPSLLVLWGVCWMFYPDTLGQNDCESNANWQREFDVEVAEPIASTEQPDVHEFMPFATPDYQEYPFELSYENGLLSTHAVNTGSDMLDQHGFAGVASSPTPAFQQIEPPIYAHGASSGNIGTKEQFTAGHSYVKVPLKLLVDVCTKPFVFAPSIATQSALPPQPDTSAQSTHHICPVCSKAYTLSYNLGRHQLEQGHTVGMPASSTTNGSSTNLPREFLCPNLPCHKAQIGNGFPRKHLLQRHVASLCKFRPEADRHPHEPSPPNQDLSETQLLLSHTSKKVNKNANSGARQEDSSRASFDKDRAIYFADRLVTPTEEQLAPDTDTTGYSNIHIRADSSIGMKRSLEQCCNQLQEQLHTKEQQQEAESKQLQNTQNDCKRLRKQIFNLRDAISSFK